MRLYPSFPCAWAGLVSAWAMRKGKEGLMLSCQICIEACRALVGSRMRDLVGLAVWEWSLLECLAPVGSWDKMGIGIRGRGDGPRVWGKRNYTYNIHTHIRTGHKRVYTEYMDRGQDRTRNPEPETNKQGKPWIPPRVTSDATCIPQHTTV